jgi:hypothetical protein
LESANTSSEVTARAEEEASKGEEASKEERKKTAKSLAALLVLEISSLLTDY